MRVRALFAQSGIAGLSVRKVAERAGVNLGMFHYHFRTKDAFVRALLQRLYDDMFASWSSRPPAMRVRSQRCARRRTCSRASFATTAAAAAPHGRRRSPSEPIAVEFVAPNLPRHIGVIGALVAAGQRAGGSEPVPIAQALAFIAGAVGGPILIGGAIMERDEVPVAMRRGYEQSVLSDAALSERVDLVLAGLCAPPKRVGRA
jgi:AcrR family transcriptional regulator